MDGNSNISTHNRREAMDKVIVIARIRLFVVCENIILQMIRILITMLIKSF